MSNLDVAITVSVGVADDRYVQVIRGETVIPASMDSDPGSTVDLVDLARAALDRLGTDSLTTAAMQLEQLRGLFEEQLNGGTERSTARSATPASSHRRTPTKPSSKTHARTRRIVR